MKDKEYPQGSEPPVLGDRLICVNGMTMPGFPNDCVIAAGETVVLDGYVEGNPVIKLDPVLHPPTYKHLKYRSGMLEMDMEEFGRQFKKVL